jgi:hypothetical protein
MTVGQAIRDAAARRAVLYQYAQAHDRFADLEQRLVAKDCPIGASAAHDIALTVLRAYRAETDDPKPKGLP